jgi:hypothetical protein
MFESSLGQKQLPHDTKSFLASQGTSNARKITTPLLSKQRAYEDGKVRQVCPRGLLDVKVMVFAGIGALMLAGEINSESLIVFQLKLFKDHVQTSAAFVSNLCGC